MSDSILLDSGDFFGIFSLRGDRMSDGPGLQGQCPYCGGAAYAEYVDVGVGYQQVAAAQCSVCEAVQLNPYSDDSFATDEERRTRWCRGPRDPKGSYGLQMLKCRGSCAASKVCQCGAPIDGHPIDNHAPSEGCSCSPNPYDSEPEDLEPYRRALRAPLPPPAPMRPRRRNVGG